MPTLALLGLSHHSAPVELRERLAFSDETLSAALLELRARGDEAYILSTCNRTELYVVHDDAAARPLLVDFFEHAQQVPATEFDAHCYFKTDDEAARHLFRVASGLDSMVLGEDQVLGQVRSAFQAAQTARTTRHWLGKLLPMAIGVGKRVRAETSIGRGALSPSSVAVSLAQRTLGDLRSRSVLIIGAGEAGKVTARSLVQAGVERILVANRSQHRAEQVTAAVPSIAVPYSALTEALHSADIAISCTSASEHIVSVEELRGVMDRRPDRPLLCIDIAVPRDLDPAIADIPAVHLYNIDDLEEASAGNREERVREAGAAEAIVDQAVEEYQAWQRTQRVVPIVGTLYARAEAIRRAEVERTLPRLESLSAEDRARIEVMTAAIVKRLLHDPVSVLKERADSSDSTELARLTRELFALPLDGNGSTDPP